MVGHLKDSRAGAISTECLGFTVQRVAHVYLAGGSSSTSQLGSPRWWGQGPSRFLGNLPSFASPLSGLLSWQGVLLYLRLLQLGLIEVGISSKSSLSAIFLKHSEKFHSKLTVPGLLFTLLQLLNLVLNHFKKLFQTSYIF